MVRVNIPNTKALGLVVLDKKVFYVSLLKTITTFDPRANNLNKLNEGPLDDAPYHQGFRPCGFKQDFFLSFPYIYI